MPSVDYNLAFWIVCLICVGFMAVITVLFKLLKWL
jgi:hypothetical protein